MHTENPKELFRYWIAERNSVYHKKEELKLPKPWSQDPIFRNTYFTNVHREKDKVTRFVRSWANGYSETSVGALVLARMFNRPETLMFLGYPHKWDPWPACDRIKDYRDKGKQLFSGAYLITTCGVKMDKVDYVFRVADDAQRQVKVMESDTCKSVHKKLTKVNGLGSFLAAQVVADLKNTLGCPLQDAPDKNTFVASGPGSVKGLTYYHDKSVTPATFHNYIWLAWEEYEDFWQSDPITYPPMDMQDFQNCFCEFSKYMRVRAGGSSKRNYKG